MSSDADSSTVGKLTLSFPICYVLLHFDLRTVPKRRFRIGTSDFRNFMKITKMQISLVKKCFRNHEFHDFHEISKIRGSDSKSPFRDRPEVEIQQNWKAESLSFPTVEESASEDITIKSYGHFEIP